MGTLTETSAPPRSIMPVEGAIRWTFNFTPDNTDTQKEYAVFRVIDVTGGSPIKSQPFVFDKEGTIPIDLQRLMSDFVVTTPPDVEWSTSTVYEDTTVKFVVHIEYGIMKVTFGDTCIRTESTSGTTDDITVINAGVPLYQDNPFISVKGEIYSPDIFMTNRPKNVEMCAHSMDWLWGCGDLDIQVRGFDSSGAPTATINLAAVNTSGSNIYPVGFASLGVTAATCKLEVYHDQGAAVYELLYKVMRKPCCQYEDLTDVYFLEPMGGYALMSFDRISKIESVVSRTEIERLIDYGLTIKEQRKSGGKTVIGNSGFYRFTLEKEFVTRIDRTDWVNNFLNSPIKYIKRVNRNNQSYLIKFMTLPATYPVFEKNKKQVLKVIGYYHVDNASQSEA